VRGDYRAVIGELPDDERTVCQREIARYEAEPQNDSARSMLVACDKSLYVYRTNKRTEASRAQAETDADPATASADAPYVAVVGPLSPDEKRECRSDIIGYEIVAGEEPGSATLPARLSGAVKSLKQCVDEHRRIERAMNKRKEREEAKEKARNEDDEREALEQKLRRESLPFVRKWMSVRLCYSAGKNSQSKRELADERAAARAGLGFVNKARVYILQQRIVIAEKVRLAAERELKGRHLTAIPCPSMKAENIDDCIDDKTSGDSWGTNGDSDNGYEQAANEIAEAAFYCTPWQELAPRKAATD